jgi:hypothetical protein
MEQIEWMEDITAIDDAARPSSSAIGCTYADWGRVYVVACAIACRRQARRPPRLSKARIGGRMVQVTRVMITEIGQKISISFSVLAYLCQKPAISGGQSGRYSSVRNYSCGVQR